MLPKNICIVLAATCVAVPAFAQPPAGQITGKAPLNGAGFPMVRKLDKDTTYISAADVAAMIESAEKEAKGGAPLVVGDVLKLAPYEVDLEYHHKGNPTKDVGFHPKDAEYVYVVQGSGVMVTGGTRTADHMHIEGGEAQKLSKGDFIIIPPGTPHLITRTDRNLAMISMHIPMPTK